MTLYVSSYLSLKNSIQYNSRGIVLKVDNTVNRNIDFDRSYLQFEVIKRLFYGEFH